MKKLNKEAFNKGTENNNRMPLNETILKIATGAVIAIIMLCIGFGITGSIKKQMAKNKSVYDAAAKITSEEEFRKAMNSYIGNAFVYGELEALDPVTYPDVDGEYSFLRKEEQEYKRHSRLVTKTYTDSNGDTKTKTETEYYREWDTVWREEKTATKISFLGVDFDYGKIKFPSSERIETVSIGHNRRNVYYGTKSRFTGTIYCKISNGDISNVKFYKNKTIGDTIESLNDGSELVIFWLVWIMAIVAIDLVVVGYLTENKVFHKLVKYYEEGGV